jgi:hypothetical protein
MSMVVLFIVALIAAFSVVYLVCHAPITKTVFGRAWSPRLFLCKLLVPADVVLTFTLIVAPMFAGVQGIMAFAAGAITAAGLTAGVIFIKKIMVPRWRQQFKSEKAALAA